MFGARSRGMAMSGLLVVALLGAVGPSAATAGCVGPTLAVGDTVSDTAAPTHGGTVRSGQVITVTGVWFRSGCDDVMVSGPGCRPSRSIDPEAPLEDVSLTFRQGSGAAVLGVQDAADREHRYEIQWRVIIPPDAQAGPAVLEAGSATLPVTVSP